MSERNIGASVRGRLQNYARASGQDFNLVLTRYAIERLLFRISTSSYVRIPIVRDRSVQFDVITSSDSY